MYPNESVNDYIRNILGYPDTNNMYIDANQVEYPIINQQLNRNQELEQYYPEIYRVLYPMIAQRCSRVTERITGELIDSMTDEIYNAIEVNNEINLNINLQNESVANRKMNGREIQKSVSKSEAGSEEKVENRQIKNRGLQDIIKILIIRELLDRHRPSFHGRPPFPHGGNRPPYFGGAVSGRPPIGNRDYDIFE